MKTLNSAFVWDVDETLGSFTTLDDIVTLLENYLDRKLSKREVYHILDIFPEILRPNIIKILKSLKKQKQRKGVKMIIYTNNNGPNDWVNKIKGYLESKAQTR